MSLDDLARELGQGIDCCDEEACCDDDGDCGPGEHCVEGECYENECDDENCPPGQPGCECPPGQHCEGGECVTGPCDDDGDCAPGQECVDGDCTCDDDDDCPSGDACADGLCEDCPGECCDNADCDDGNPCTMDVCSRGECNHFPKNCDDHNVCTDDHCNPIDGSCYHTPSSYCDDDNPCTEDECDPVTGECTHTCDECADCPYGLCFGCECETTNCDVNISAEPSTVCWGSPVELTIGTSCDPACGSMAWTITAEPVNTVEFIDMPSGNTPCDNSSHVHTVQARIACVPPEQITFRIDGDRGGTECSDTATITTMECITIIGERINQDDPASTTWIGLAEGAPIFGGSEPSTADNGRLMIDPEPGVMDIKWWVIAEGCGQFAAPPSGPEATTWNLGDILQPCPGLITFYVQVTFEDGKQQCGDFKSEIGVRTDDVIVVGWINGWQVPLNPNGVNQEILNIFWPPGPPVPSSIDCNDFVFDLSLFDATPNGIDLTPADRIYILHWLFRYAGNPDPIAVLGPLEFRTVDDSMIDYGKVALYKNTKTHYKLFNHFQTRYLANDDGYTELVSLRAETDIGSTINPCGPLFGVLDILPGQTGWKDGFSQIVGNERVCLINDGSPDAAAVRAFNTLHGKSVPWIPAFWENIGSQIRFSYTSLTDPEDVLVQNYPTYYEFRNGRLVRIFSQASMPQAHFYINPYPFGPVPCSWILGSPPGGRCGDAGNTPPQGARRPPYIVP